MPEDKGDLSPKTTANEVESFLKRRLVGRGFSSELMINTEDAKILAIKIAHAEEEIFDTAMAFGYGDYYDDPDNTDGQVRVVLHNYSDGDKPNLHITGFTDELGGMGDTMPSGGRAINFHARNGFKSELAKEFGVNADYYFGVSLFTDTKTQEEIKDLLEKGKISQEFMYTYYYFDNDGNSAKSIQLPADFPDDRPILSADQYYKTVAEKLSVGDFELAETAINLLKDGVTRSYKKKLGL